MSSKQKGKKTSKGDQDKHKGRYQKIFKLYDRDKDGLVEMEFFGEMLRSAGGYPLEKELEEITAQLKKNAKGGMFNMAQFEAACKEHIKTDETLDDLIKAFKYYDTENTGRISLEDLKESLTTIGDCLTEDEMKEFIKEADLKGTGSFDYVDYAKKLMKNYL